MNNLWKRLKVFFLCLVAGQSASTQNLRAGDDTGLIGSKLSAIEKSSDLFLFFHLARTGAQDLPTRQTLVSFKPTGEAFRALVTLDVTTDQREVIKRLRLEVARSFIEDPRQGVFAADLVKSYLASAGGASESIDSLAKEISARAMLNSAAPVLSAQPRPVLSGQPSAAYQTYAGKGPAQTLSSRSGLMQVSLQNQNPGGVPTLEIIMSAADQ